MRALVCVAFLAMVGCGGSGFPRPAFPYDDASALVRDHMLSRRPIRSLRAEARVEQRGEGGRLRGTVMMFVERPGRVRFDAMTQFGPVAILTSDGAQFRLLDLRERRFLYGATCPSNLAKLLGISMHGDAIEGLLLGEVPRVMPSSRTMGLDDDGLYHVVDELEGGERQESRLAISEADRDKPPGEQLLRLVRVERFRAGRLLWRIAYDGEIVREVDGVSLVFPSVVEFEDVVADRSVRIRFVAIDANVEVPAEAFTQEPPPGVAEEESPCEP